VCSPEPVKILSIAHPAVSRQAGRLRYHSFATHQDIDVHLVVPQRWQEYGRTIMADAPDDPGVTVHVLPILLGRVGRMSWYLHFYPGLRRLVNRIQPDVIHLWEEPWSMVALHACLLKGRAALVMEVDQNILKRLPPPFEAVRQYVLRSTDHVLARSSDAESVVRGAGYRGPVSRIGYGVDSKTFRPNLESVVATRDAQSLRIGYVGRVIEEKGLDDALDAIALTKSPVSLAIMGEGPHVARLQERAHRLRLDGRVTLRSWGSAAEVADFMRGLDVLILLTRTTKLIREQFGRVILEAQSCGVPVIGSTCGAIPNTIGDGGWIVPESDPNALTKILDSIAEDTCSRRLAGLAARKNVATRFTYAAVARDLVDAWTAARLRRATYGVRPAGAP
jgi:glycosyltransferase involved in cell wall biosynthesis